MVLTPAVSGQFHGEAAPSRVLKLYMPPGAEHHLPLVFSPAAVDTYRDSVLVKQAGLSGGLATVVSTSPFNIPW